MILIQNAASQFQAARAYLDGSFLGSNPFDEVKVQILRLIYHLYFDGSRENLEVGEKRSKVLDFLEFERERIDKLVEGKISPGYYEYLFLHLIKIVRSFYSQISRTNNAEHKKVCKILSDWCDCLFSKVAQFDRAVMSEQMNHEIAELALQMRERSSSKTLTKDLSKKFTTN